jgi:hypothetical protein
VLLPLEKRALLLKNAQGRRPAKVNRSAAKQRLCRSLPVPFGPLRIPSQPPLLHQPPLLILLNLRPPAAKVADRQEVLELDRSRHQPAPPRNLL